MSGNPMIKIDGLAEFQKSLRQMDANLPKQLRVMLNSAVTVVIDWAVPRIPRKTGRAAASVKARSGQREARVAMGGTRAPWMPWLDFGGRVGPKDSVVRPFRREGRYLYPGLAATHEEVTAIMEKGMVELAATAGLEVT
jgi:hypothetical protein